MKIREIMTRGVATADLSTTLEEIATIMRHEDVGAVPIVDDGELVGLVTDRDIVVRCVAEGGDPRESIAEDVLTGGLVTVSPDADVEEAARLLSTHKIRRLPVVRDGQLEGMVSLGDIAEKQPRTRFSVDTLEDVSRGRSERVQPKPEPAGGKERGLGNHRVEEEQRRRPSVISIDRGGRAASARKSQKKRS
jgi:CBS domain-containing protein